MQNFFETSHWYTNKGKNRSSRSSRGNPTPIIQLTSLASLKCVWAYSASSASTGAACSCLFKMSTRAPVTISNCWYLCTTVPRMRNAAVLIVLLFIACGDSTANAAYTHSILRKSPLHEPRLKSIQSAMRFAAKDKSFSQMLWKYWIQKNPFQN